MYSDKEFCDAVVAALKRTGKELLTTREATKALREDGKTQALYKNVSWAQKGPRFHYRPKTSTRPSWSLTDFPDRVVRNLKNVALKDSRLEHYQEENGTYSASYFNTDLKVWGRKQLPKYKNYFKLVS